MTNYEKIKSLDKEELAWLLMNNCTSGGENACDLCVWKHWDEVCQSADRSCIQGHRDFLDREVTEEDEMMYAVAHNNVVVDIFNNMSEEEQIKYEIVCREINGRKYANTIELRDDTIPPYCFK